MFSATSRGTRTFPLKHLNIVDPLKENNNLGRSVSKGNFYRIRSAFTYGARKLGRILSQSEDNVGDEIRQFFSNTLERHGKGQRPDVQDPLPLSVHNDPSAASLFLGTKSQESQIVCETDSVYSGGITGESRLNHEGSLHSGVTDVEITGSEVISDRLVDEPLKDSLEATSSSDLSKTDSSLNGTAVSDNRLKGDAKDLATSRLQSLTISNDTPKSSPTSGEANASPLINAHHAPHLYFTCSSTGNGEMNGYQHIKQAEHDESAENTDGNQDENQVVRNYKAASPVGSKQNLSRLSSFVLSSEDCYPSYACDRMSAAVAGTPDHVNTLSDLSGDYKKHLRSLHDGRLCYERALAASDSPTPPMVIQFQNKKSWEVIRQSVQLKQKVFSQMNTNGLVHRPTFYSINPPLLPGGIGFTVEEMPKPRGTGTYFPNMNHYRDRPITPRERNQAPVRSPRNNGRVVTLATENGFLERSARDNGQAQIFVHKGNGKSGSSDDPSDSPRRKVNSNGNGATHQPELFADYGSIGYMPLEVPPLLRGSWQTNSGSPAIQNLGANLSSPGTEKQRPMLSMDKDRIAEQSYALKDEDDFPPLSV